MSKRPAKKTKAKRSVKRTPNTRELARRPKDAAIKNSDPREFFNEEPDYRAEVEDVVRSATEVKEAMEFLTGKASPVSNAWYAYDLCRDALLQMHGDDTHDANLTKAYPCGCCFSCSKIGLTLQLCAVHQMQGLPA